MKGGWTLLAVGALLLSVPSRGQEPFRVETITCENGISREVSFYVEPGDPTRNVLHLLGGSGEHRACVWTAELNDTELGTRTAGICRGVADAGYTLYWITESGNGFGPTSTCHTGCGMFDNQAAALGAGYSGTACVAAEAVQVVRDLVGAGNFLAITANSGGGVRGGLACAAYGVCPDAFVLAGGPPITDQSTGCEGGTRTDCLMGWDHDASPEDGVCEIPREESLCWRDREAFLAGEAEGRLPFDLLTRVLEDGLIAHPFWTVPTSFVQEPVTTGDRHAVKARELFEARLEAGRPDRWVEGPVIAGGAHNCDGVGSCAALMVSEVELHYQSWLDGPPKKPRNLKVSPLESREIEAKWKDKSGNELYFELQMKGGEQNSYRTAAITVADATRVVVSGLSPDTSYTFRLRSGNSSGVSKWTKKKTATTEPD